MVKHDTVLITSGSMENRARLREVFHDTYNLLEAASIPQLELLLRQNLDCIAVVVLDITGQEVTDDEPYRTSGISDMLKSIPVIIISENDDPNMLNRAFLFGAADVIPIGYDPYAMLHRVESIADLYLHKQHFETMVQEQAETLRRSNDALVSALSSIIEYRSVESGQHILRIRHFTKILLEEVKRACPEYALDDRAIDIISSAAALHDIGKIAIPDSILMKPGRLTAEERKIMQTHSVTGCQILETVVSMADKDYLRYAYNICRYHHERWDGKGYPDGLAGDEIPICAQVVGLADAYDALTSKRAYKEAFSFSTAVNMIIKGECGLFSPKLLECFKHVMYKYEDLAKAYADGLSPNDEEMDFRLEAPAKEEQQDSMQRLQGKYYALLHYINGFLIELDIDKQTFDLRYNPYPEFTGIQQADSLEEISDMTLKYIIHPDDRARMQDFFDRQIGNFIQAGLRRESFWFKIRNAERPEGENVELTLMRINPLDKKRRMLALLIRKVEHAAPPQMNELRLNMVDCTYASRYDEGFTLIKAADEFETITGYTVEEVRERFGGRTLDIIHPQDREMRRRKIDRQFRDGNLLRMEYRLIDRSGRIRYIQDRTVLFRDTNGTEYLYTQMTDITPARSEFADSDALKRLEKYEQILSKTENVLFEWDIVQDQLSFSSAWRRIFGFEPAMHGFWRHLSGQSHIHPDDVPTLMDKVANIESGAENETAEVRIATDKGRYRWFRIRAAAMRRSAGKLEKISGVLINIDQEKQAAQVLQLRAEYDALTKLLNKDAARKQAEAYFSRYTENLSCALMIIDLDNFKYVNDRYGHLFGDAILTQAAREIKKLFRNQDIVARIGGDEFMVLLRGITDRVLLERRCQQLLQAFRNAFQNKKYQLPLSCSIGVAQAPQNGHSYFELYQHADEALYQAKAKGKNTYAFYDSAKAMPDKLTHRSAVNEKIDSDNEPSMANDSIVRYVFEKLYSSKFVDESVINEVLAYIGRKMNVSRVYVFENSHDHRFCSNTYEWCNEGIHSEIENLQNVSYETDIPGYSNNFNEDGIFYCSDINALSEDVRDILAPQGIKSMLQCAFRENGVFWGYIGFDECEEHRLWTKEQIELLTFFGKTLSMFLLQLRRQERVRRQANEWTTMLDNQDASICVVDPETYTLKFVNEKVRGRDKTIRAGQICYKAVFGLDMPCRHCPVAEARSRGFCRRLERDESGKTLLVEGTMIQWNGEEACMVSMRELPE